MKTSDRLRIAAQNLKGLWALLPIAGMAIGMFCLCFAGAILTSVSGEKALPCELDVSTEGKVKITDSALVQISEIEGILDATPLLQVPVTVQTGAYTAELTLTGIETYYLDEAYAEGSIFPADTVMPYIVLNEAACKKFSEDEDNEQDEAPEIDWLGAGFTVKTGEDSRSVTSRVCGVLRGEVEEPIAYVNLAIAEELLNEKGTNAYTSAKVRVVNIGQAERISKAIQAMGLTVDNPNTDQQEKWNMRMKEMGYLIITGIFSLLCASFLISAWRQISLLKQRRAWDMLWWMGMRERDIAGLFVIQSGIISLIGVAMGIIVALCLPSFLPQQMSESSVFMLPIPWGIAIAGAVFCVLAGMSPMLCMKKGITNTI